MDRLQSIFHLGLKEFASLARDAAMVFLIAYAFTYNVYGPAKGAQMELRNASVAIVDEDRSMLSGRLADALIPPFFLRPQAIGIGDIDAAMDRGRFTFVIDIPPRFQADVEAGRHPTVQVNVDATSMSQAGRGTGYIEAIFAAEISRFLGVPPARLPVGLVTRAKFNPNLEDTWFLAVSQLINNITLLAIILSGAALVREREHGTMEHLLVLPLTPADIMLAKVWSNAVVIVAASTLSLEIIVKRVLDVPLAGSVPLFMAGTTIYLFSMTALGIFLATLARSMPQFGLLAFPVFIILNLLSGGSTPLDSMPRWLQQTMQFSPTTHYVNLAMSVLYRGAEFDSVWRDFAAVIAIGAVFFVGALVRFRKTVSAIQS
jgi:ABC-type multidrug transport system permease subunit